MVDRREVQKKEERARDPLCALPPLCMYLVLSHSLSLFLALFLSSFTFLYSLTLDRVTCAGRVCVHATRCASLVIRASAPAAIVVSFSSPARQHAITSSRIREVGQFLCTREIAKLSRTDRHPRLVSSGNAGIRAHDPLIEISREARL